jgi:hypothetical protein
MKILIFTFLIGFTFNVPCGSYLPKDTLSCTPSGTPENYCCLLQTYINSVMVSTCYPIPRLKYLALEDQMTLNDITYNIDCGIDVGTNCGNIYSPVGYKDCGKFSTQTSACCYFKYKEDTGCIWSGNTSVGIVEYNGLTIVCSQNYARLNIFAFFILFLIYLF